MSRQNNVPNQISDIHKNMLSNQDKCPIHTKWVQIIFEGECLFLPN